MLFDPHELSETAIASPATARASNFPIRMASPHLRLAARKSALREIRDVPSDWLGMGSSPFDSADAAARSIPGQSADVARGGSKTKRRSRPGVITRSGAAAEPRASSQLMDDVLSNCFSR